VELNASPIALRTVLDATAVGTLIALWWFVP